MTNPMDTLYDAEAQVAQLVEKLGMLQHEVLVYQAHSTALFDAREALRDAGTRVSDMASATADMVAAIRDVDTASIVAQVQEARNVVMLGLQSEREASVSDMASATGDLVEAIRDIDTASIAAQVHEVQNALLQGLQSEREASVAEMGRLQTVVEQTERQLASARQAFTDHQLAFTASFVQNDRRLRTLTWLTSAAVVLSMAAAAVGLLM